MNDDWEIPGLQINNKLNIIIDMLSKQEKKINNIEEKLENQQQTIEKYKKQYNEILTILENTKEILKNSDKKTIEEIKPILQKIKLNNEKITNNFSSAIFKQRNDNLFWRSQSHNFATNFCNLSNLGTFLPFKKDKK